ncbi:MAG: hypothetical protein R3F18_01835 [Lysobacterales bacterium]
MSTGFWSRDRNIMAGACALVGLATGAWLALSSAGDGYWMFLIAAPLAAFATAALCWWSLLERPGIHSRKQAAIAGALAGVAAHYPCWWLLMLGNYVFSFVSTGTIDTSDAGPIGPLSAFWAAAVYSMFSLLFVGWVTAPAGAVIGALVAHWRLESAERAA